MTIQSSTRRFAWYGRLSTKDKQDPTPSFPSQRAACAKKAAEVGGQIVCDFTDQEAGRRDDRDGRSRLVPALDQFEVEKLGREVRRGQTENTRQGCRTEASPIRRTARRPRPADRASDRRDRGRCLGLPT